MPSGALTSVEPDSGVIKIKQDNTFISIRDLNGATVAIEVDVNGVFEPLLDEGVAVAITADDDSNYLIGGGSIKLVGTTVTTPVTWAVRNGTEK